MLLKFGAGMRVEGRDRLSKASLEERVREVQPDQAVSDVVQTVGNVAAVDEG